MATSPLCGIYYHCDHGANYQLLVVMLLKLLSGQLPVAVDHSQPWTMVLETVDPIIPIDCPLPPPYTGWGQWTEHHLHIPLEHHLHMQLHGTNQQCCLGIAISLPMRPLMVQGGQKKNLTRVVPSLNSHICHSILLCDGKKGQ